MRLPRFLRRRRRNRIHITFSGDSSRLAKSLRDGQQRVTDGRWRYRSDSDEAPVAPWGNDAIGA